MFKQLETLLDLSKAGFKPIDQKGSKYFTVIGRLIVSFSTSIDSRLNESLKSQVWTSEAAIPRILIGEMRSGDVMASLKRIGRARKVSVSVIEEIDRLFVEIETLRKVRDVVAHRACMVKGDSLAFHNALSARTDESIQVDIYTLKELREFSNYANRLGARVGVALAELVPEPMNIATEAYLALASHVLLMKTISAFIETGKLKGERLSAIRDANKAAKRAMDEYTESARKVDPEFLNSAKDATRHMRRLMALVMQVGVPDNVPLQEIPARLRKPDRAATASKPTRKRLSSPK